MGIDATATIGSRRFAIDLSAATSLAIPLVFGGAQPNAFFLPKATSVVVRQGSFIGDTRLGGSANCATVSLSPHGNGTHTECVGHIAVERIAVTDVLSGGLFSAAVVSVTPERLDDVPDSDPAPATPTDAVISRAAIRAAVDRVHGASDTDALIVRVPLGGTDKSAACWSGDSAPYFTRDAMEWIAAGGWTHLVTELPSVDRDDDEGALLNHRTWWGMGPGDVNAPSPLSSRTITEMAFVPADLPDGLVALALEIPAFVLDAAPSRPITYPLRELP